jgi:hypothetical protein
MIKKTLLFSAIIVCCLVINNRRGDAQSLLSYVDSSYQTYSFEYPKIEYPLISFDITSSKIPIVPYYNAVFVNDTDSILFINPDSCINVALDYSLTDNSVWVLNVNAKCTKIVKHLPEAGSNSFNEVIRLKKGLYDFAVISDDSILIWGSSDTLNSHVFLWANNQLDTLVETNNPVTSAFMVNNNTVLFSFEDKIVIKPRDKKPILYYQCDFPIESFAYNAENEMFISTPYGILKIDRQKNLSFITTLIHGMLRVINHDVYILWQEKSQVVLLKKKT